QVYSFKTVVVAFLTKPSFVTLGTTSSCNDRCGESYYRGDICHCDYDCLLHKECCSDYEAFCTTVDSCKGRCGETFQRGKQCYCDVECSRYNQCCPDYRKHCTIEAKIPDGTVSTETTPPAKVQKLLDSTLTNPFVLNDEVKPSAVTAQTPVATEDLAKSTVSPVPDDEVKLPAVTPQSPVGTEDLAKSTMSPEPENIASQTTAHNGVPSSVSVEGIKDMFTLTHTSVHTSLPEPSERHIPVPSTSSGTVTIQSTVPSKHPSDSVGENNDTNICSGRPANALTTLQNGTMIVFRGHFFWTFGSNGALGHPRRITEEWGIPSPIDTVFTRCNCQGKTFIFKANEYWRFDNGVMDRGYPKLISKGFGGMSGRITAALSVPAFGKRREAVYFFKRGGLVQKYSYKQEPSQSCGKPQTQYRIYSLHSRITRQAGPVYLGKEINIKLTWKGFPTSVTSAISLPNSKKPDGYDYFVFSRAKYYNIIINSDQPAVTPLLKSVTHKDTAKDWYHCP
uniref:Proteoglycan 4a n=1 Tax=Lepisosteus oculatus TaxID=7918 RepID=W5M012_LEPOC